MGKGLLAVGFVIGYYLHKTLDESIYAIREKNPKLDNLFMGMLIGGASFFFFKEMPKLLSELKKEEKLTSS